MKRKLTWLAAGASAAMLVGLTALSGCASQSPTAPIGMEQKIESAHTRADHEDIARQFEQQSVIDKAAGERHRGYARSYLRNPAPRGGDLRGLAEHCQWLAVQYEQAANENLELARMHRDIALQTK